MYLGIDLGDKRCGIALFLERVVVPKDIVIRAKLVPVLKKMIGEYNIKTIVVGLPYDLHGIQLKQLEKTQNFIEKLKNIFPEMLIKGHDERFSSFEAQSVLSDMGITEQEGQKDALAAAIILESYLKKNHII